MKLSNLTRFRWPVLLLVALVGAVAVGAIVVRSHQLSAAQSVDSLSTPESSGSNATPSLRNVVEEFTAQMPGEGSEGYHPPSDVQRDAFSSGVQALLRGNLTLAVELLEPLSYQVTAQHDDQMGRDLLVLHEIPLPDGQWPHGWGLYVISPAASSDLIVEVPHPLYDVNTAEIGTALFEDGDARALFIAGTHRYADSDGSADVAHVGGSVFEAVNEVLVTPGSVVVQPHGFDAGAHPGDGSVVLSGGVAKPPPLVTLIAAHLANMGIVTCTYGVSDSCADLGGTENVQGQWVVKQGATFVQVEMSRAIRDDAALWQKVIAVLVSAVN